MFTWHGPNGLHYAGAPRIRVRLSCWPLLRKERSPGFLTLQGWRVTELSSTDESVG